MRRSLRLPVRRAAGGFTLIDVLIALAVLAVGLLGVALMQTLNLRYTRSADQRSKAINLAGEMLDMIRANRSQVGAYTAITPASFTGTALGGCTPPNNLNASDNIDRWKCEVREELGEDATAAVTIPAAGRVQVTVTWGDAAAGPQQAANDTTRSVTLVTQL